MRTAGGPGDQAGVAADRGARTTDVRTLAVQGHAHEDVRRPALQLRVRDRRGPVVLEPGGQRVVLSALTRALTTGEIVIVTLYFEGSGALGLVSSVE